MARKGSKSAKIRALIDKGLDQKDIVKKLNVSPQLVYIVSRNYGKLKPVKQRKPAASGKDQKFISKLLALVDAYRNSK